MSDFLDDCLKLAAGLERDLALVELAQDWQRESYCTEEEADQDEVIHLLELYCNKTEAALSFLEWHLKKLVEQRSSVS